MKLDSFEKLMDKGISVKLEDQPTTETEEVDVSHIDEKTKEKLINAMTSLVNKGKTPEQAAKALETKLAGTAHEMNVEQLLYIYPH